MKPSDVQLAMDVARLLSGNGGLTEDEKAALKMAWRVITSALTDAVHPKIGMQSVSDA